METCEGFEPGSCLAENSHSPLILAEPGQHVVVTLADGSRAAVFSDGSYLRRMPGGTLVSGLMRTENGRCLNCGLTDGVHERWCANTGGDFA